MTDSATRIPVWVSLIAIMPLTFGISSLLRFGHDQCCKQRRKKDAALYHAVYSGVDLMQAVESLARFQKSRNSSKNIVVPAQMIGFMIQNSGSDLDLTDACRHYLSTYMEEV